MDTKDYLRDLIDHYNIILSQNKVSELNSFIQEEQQKCQHRLYKLKTLDMEATLTANAFASVFPGMNLI